MAGRVAAAGHRLTVWNRTRATRPRRWPPSSTGVTVADTAREAAAAADVVIVSLADDAAVRAAYRGEDGLVAGLAPGHGRRGHQHGRARRRSADSRTTSARPGRRWSTPRSRAASPASRAARILVMAGGEADAVERARPALESFAQRIILLGPLGSGLDDEAGGQRDGVRAQPDPGRGAGARREGRRRARAGLRGDRQQRGGRAVRGLQAGGVRAPRVRRRSPSRSTWSPRTSTSPPPSPAASARPSPSSRPTAAWSVTRSTPASVTPT